MFRFIHEEIKIQVWESHQKGKVEIEMRRIEVNLKVAMSWQKAEGKKNETPTPSRTQLLENMFVDPTGVGIAPDDSYIYICEDLYPKKLL